MNIYLKSLLCLCSAVTFMACGPSKYTMHLEMRHPSRSGLDLSGKTVSVVYLEDGRELQDGFSANMAQGFAQSIEKDSGEGEGSVGVFRMHRSEGADYASKDTLTNLLIETGSDVVFLLDTVKFGVMSIGTTSKVASSMSPDSSYITSGSIPFTIKMFCLDAMDKTESVRSFGGTSVVQPSVYSDGKQVQQILKEKAYKALPEEGLVAGELIGDSFESEWKVEGYSIAYFDSTKWTDAVRLADQFDWKGAMDIWFTLLDSKDILKRSCAAYNIALSCYMLGDYKLASEWLDLSDSESELPMSTTLRKRIAGRIN